MTKQEALAMANGSVKKLARLLTENGYKITHNAICRWSDDKIPELRARQLKEIQEKKND